MVENKKILADIKYLSKYCHTGNLEVFHAVLKQILSKKAPLYVGGHDNEDTVGSVKL